METRILDGDEIHKYFNSKLYLCRPIGQAGDCNYCIALLKMNSQVHVCACLWNLKRRTHDNTT